MKERLYSQPFNNLQKLNASKALDERLRNSWISAYTRERSWTYPQYYTFTYIHLLRTPLNLINATTRLDQKERKKNKQKLIRLTTFKYAVALSNNVRIKRERFVLKS
jgi:hypothetical protein